MARLGTAIGGDHVLALRAPSLLMAALLPWLMSQIGGRWFCLLYTSDAADHLPRVDLAARRIIKETT